MHSAQGLPTVSYTATGARALLNTWIRALPPSATYTFPFASTANECGEFNSPSFDHRAPAAATNRPRRSNLAIRGLLPPSRTKTFPERSRATSVGRLRYGRAAVVAAPTVHHRDRPRAV